MTKNTPLSECPYACLQRRCTLKPLDGRNSLPRRAIVALPGTQTPPVPMPARRARLNVRKGRVYTCASGRLLAGSVFCVRRGVGNVPDAKSAQGYRACGRTSVCRPHNHSAIPPPCTRYSNGNYTREIGPETSSSAVDVRDGRRGSELRALRDNGATARGWIDARYWQPRTGDFPPTLFSPRLSPGTSNLVITYAH